MLTTYLQFYETYSTQDTYSPTDEQKSKRTTRVSFFYLLLTIAALFLSQHIFAYLPYHTRILICLGLLQNFLHAYLFNDHGL